MADFHNSPLGTLEHPWVNVPDTKYNPDGLFHTKLVCRGPEAEATAELIEAASMRYLAEYTQEMTKGEAKKWSLYVPFERLEDEDGNPTGDIRFTFKQNAKIKSAKEPSGFKTITIGLRDSKGKPIDVPVWGGSEGRTQFTMRGVATSSSKVAGVRLDLSKVQISKLKSGGGGSEFGEIEGGYVGDEAPEYNNSAPETDGGADDTGGDY